MNWICCDCAYPNSRDGRCAECDGQLQPQSAELLQDCRELGERRFLLYPLAFEVAASLALMSYISVILVVSLIDPSAFAASDPRQGPPVFLAVQAAYLLIIRVAMFCLAKRHTWGVVLSPVGVGAAMLAGLGWFMAQATGTRVVEGPDWIPLVGAWCTFMATGLAIWDGVSRIAECTRLPLKHVPLIADIGVTVGIACAVLAVIVSAIVLGYVCFPVFVIFSATALIAAACAVRTFARTVRLAKQAWETLQTEGISTDIHESR